VNVVTQRTPSGTVQSTGRVVADAVLLAYDRYYIVVQRSCGETRIKVQMLQYNKAMRPLWYNKAMHPQ